MPRQPCPRADQLANAPLRAAAYTRVSTGPQAEADLSLPDQANQIQGWCQANGYVLSATFEERGASATSDKGRPQLKALLDQACDGSRPYDVVVVHSLSRFFRNQFALEGARRRLAEHGVGLISITQPLAGNDPASHLIRNVLAMFDEYQSWENRKHVKRSMNENARQGFWNGSKAPYGYRTVEAGQKGRRTKKILAIDPVEAEVVRLMYRLIVEGDGQSGPMGVKSVCTWLNARGILTRKLCRWGIGPLHDILTRPLYAGTYQFNRRDSKTRQRNPVSEIVEAPAPAIVSRELYQSVQDTLRSRRPSEAPPREVTGPVLLTGLAVCGRCGGGMTMATGTSSTGKVYRYYKCSPQMRIGEKACRGMNIGMAKLDALVTTTLEQRLLTTERLQAMLSELAARRQARIGPARDRMQALADAMTDADTRLKRLYGSIEEGIADGADPTLKQRLDTLRTDRNRARDALERLREQIREPVAIAPERVAVFASEMRARLREGAVPFRKAYIRAVIDRVEVQPDEIRITGRRDVLERAVTNGPDAAPGVRSSVREWRTRHDSNV